MARIPTAANLGAAQLRGAGGAAQLNLGVAKETGAAGNALGNAIASAGSAIGSAVSALASAAKASNDAFALPEAQLELETRLSEYDRNAYGNAGEDGAGLTAYPDGARGIAEDVFKQFAPRMSEDDQRRFKIKSGFNILRRSERAIEEGQKLAIGYADKKEGQLYTGWTTRLGESGGWANDEAVNQAWGAIRDSVRARVGHTYTPDQAAQREKQLLGQFTAERLSWLADNDPEAFKALEGKASKGIVDENAEAPRGPATGGGFRPQSNAAPVLLDKQQERLVGVNEDVVRRFAQLQGVAGRTFNVNSGYRSKAHNARVGGASKSQHIHGNAIDIDVSDLSKEERTKLIDTASALGFRGIGVYNTALHLDTGGRRAWGPDYSHKSVPGWAKDAIARHMDGGNSLAGATSPAGGAPGGGASAGTIARALDGGKGYTVVQYEDGRVERREGMYGWRNNNPGNIENSAFARKFGGMPGGGRYAVFPTEEHGLRAAEALFFDGANYRNLSIIDAVRRWAPYPENSRAAQNSYAKAMADAAGVSVNTRTGSLNAQQRRAALLAQKQAEGNRPGRAVTLKSGSGGVRQASIAPDQAPAPGRPQTDVEVGPVQVADLPPENSEAYRQLWIKHGGDVEKMRADVGGAQGVQVADLTGGAAGGVPGTSVAATGDPSPEELANRAGLKFGFDQETGQAKLALGKETADRLAQIVQENPDAKVAEYLNDEQKAALASAGLDVEGMTVSQAAALATAAAQEQGVQIAQKSSGPVVPEGDPFLSGRLLKGQTFSVKAAGGKTLTFSSEMLNAVSPKIMKQIRKAAGERQRALIKEQRYMADDMMARQVLTVEKTGHGAEKFDMGLVRQVYKGTKALAKFQRQVEVAKRSFDAKKGMADLPDEELQARLNELEADVLDEQGDADPVVEKTFERTQKAMGNLMKLRQTDPALAVQESKEVKSFVEGFLKGKPPKTPAEMYGLIDARIQAQIKLGLHPTPITKREAQKMLEPLVRAGSLTEKREQARKLSQSLREVYREHAETVMNAALYLNKRDTEDDRLTLNSTFRALMRDAAKPPASTYKGLGANRSDRLDGGNPFDRYDVAP